MNVTVHCVECDEDITSLCDFDPGYPPVPGIHNHDDPRFSDPGDPGTCDGPEKCPHCGEVITAKQLEHLYELWCEEKIDYEQGLREDAEVSAWESRRDAEYDREGWNN